MSFREKFAEASQRNGSLLCIGLDPDPERIAGGDAAAFLTAIVESTSDLVCAYKPNLAFYEQMGPAGYTLLRTVIDAVPDGIPLLADAKRGDVGHTAQAYADAVYNEWGFDAVTVNPYLGGDSVEPFVARPDKGVFIVCRTSNPGARDLQDLTVDAPGGHAPLYEVVARLAKAWNTRGNVGLVTGATYPAELARLREICPEMLFLVPGVGAQAGDLTSAVRAGLDEDAGGILVNASRSVLYASQGTDFAEAARTEALAIRAAIEQERGAVRAQSPA